MLCCQKKKGKHPPWTRSCHADVPSPVEMATVPASNNCARDVQWVQCVWDVLSILLFGCRIDLCAQIKSQAVPALHELILLRFPRWKNGSLRWMGKQEKKTLYGSSHKPEQQMGEKVTTENLSLYICTTVNLRIVSFLLGCDCSCAVIERCWKKVSPPPVWGLNHYRGICSSTGNILGVKTGTPWKHGLGLSVKCWGEPVWQAFLCLLVEFGFWQNLM